MYGSPSTSVDASPPPLAAAAASSARDTTGLVVLGLGINAWLTQLPVVLLSPEAEPLHHVVGAAALVCLALGYAARLLAARLPGREATARWLLLCGFPVLLALALGLGSDRLHETSHTYLSMPLCAASLLAYCIAAALACREPLALLVTTTHPITSRRQLPPAPRPLRAALIGLVSLGSLAIAVVAPLWPPYSAVTRGWGDAAAAGATLAALVGAATAVSVIAVHLGSLLRRSEPARSHRNRLASLVFLSVLGFVTYYVIIP